jgi:hypothetical protein
LTLPCVNPRRTTLGNRQVSSALPKALSPIRELVARNKAKVTKQNFQTFLAAGSYGGPDDCYEPADFLANGVHSAKHRTFDEFVQTGKIIIQPVDWCSAKRHPSSSSRTVRQSNTFDPGSWPRPGARSVERFWSFAALTLRLLTTVYRSSGPSSGSSRSRSHSPPTRSRSRVCSRET